MDVSSSNNTAEQQPLLPHGCSLWDRLPMELQLIIVGFAGPLTCFLCGTTATSSNGQLPRSAIVAIWNDAFALDWRGDLSLLPDTRFSALTNAGSSANMMLVSSRSMYRRLLARFSSSSQQDHDEFDEILTRGNDYTVFRFVYVSDWSKAHIAMRHCWLHLIDLRYPIAIGWQAIQYGHTALLRHLATEHLVDLAKFKRLYNSFAMDIAAILGHFDVLQMLHDAGNTSCTTRAMDYAAGNGHLHVVQWLHANRTEGCTTEAFDQAAKSGHLDVLKFLHANRTEGGTTNALTLAIANNHHAVVEWISCTPGLILYQ